MEQVRENVMNDRGEANHPATISIAAKFLIATMCVLFGAAAQAAITCERDVTANIVAMDQPVLFNRLGASNVNGMIFALGRDVVTINAVDAAITAGANLTSNTLAFNDDQVIAVGTTGLLATDVVVSAGADLTLQTAAAGDDVLSGDGLSILAGPNFMADTAAVDDVQVVAVGGAVQQAGETVVAVGPDGVLSTIASVDDQRITALGATAPLGANDPAAFVGNVALRPDKRPRPLVLRIVEGDCLTINLTNLLTPIANPIKPDPMGLGRDAFDPLVGNDGPPNEPDALPIDGINTPIDDQVLDRHVSFHVAGMQWVDGDKDDSSYVGENTVQGNVPQGGFRSYRLYAEQEGVFIARGMATTVGSDANQGNASNLLFGQVIVEPIGARIYRSQTTEEEMRLASMNLQLGDQDPMDDNGVCGDRNLTDGLQPIINYEATYPTANCDNGADLGFPVWFDEGKAGLPILNMMQCTSAILCEIVHSEINGLIVGPDPDGTWKSKCPNTQIAQDCPYPLESIGKINPVLPNRLEPFRDFASVWHDEPATAQAFRGFFTTDPVFRYVLAGVKDGFMINYGSGGIGSEIIANRLGVGPMHDCLTCAYEEFFLTSYTVGDPAQLADVAANMGLEQLAPGAAPPAGTTGPKATYVPYPEDPANVHHSYIGDFTKFRNTHVGKEQHVFHLHNHQWLYNPNDDNSNYLDAQGIGPGAGYTYEINFGGSGNRIKSAGDAIFHCHFYPHFAQGMWYMWRNHDVLETGTPLQASAINIVDGVGELGFHGAQWALENGTPLAVGTTDIDIDGVPTAFPVRARSLPDGEIVAGAPIPAIIPLPGKAMPPVPGEVTVVPNTLTKASSAFHPIAQGATVPVGSLASVKRDNEVPNPDFNTELPEGPDNPLTVEAIIHPGYPFWIAGIEDIVGQRPPTPPLDMVTSAHLTGDTDGDGTPDVQGLIDDPAYALVDVFRADGTLEVTVKNLFNLLDPDQSDGWDGGLPRTALQGYRAEGKSAQVQSPVDFSKIVLEAQAVFYPEAGTDVEQVSMAYHAIRDHASYAVDMNGTETAAPFVLNGIRPAVGAPYHEPCRDDMGDRFDAFDDVLDEANPGHVWFYNDDDGDPDDDDWSGDTTNVTLFDADNPRIYKGVNIQFDAVLNKAGYHYPQQRIISLWEDAVPIITKAKAPEPMVLRFNTFECGVYHHTNLVPETYELDDYQVRTPTDIIGQHIHLPKWDLTTADGAANGWNYEDGTLSPGAVRERIHAINDYIANDPVPGTRTHLAAVGAPDDFVLPTGLIAVSHPFFGSGLPGGQAGKWMGARTTTQRWFFDPVLNSDNIDRGLGIIFTHDHYGPSTHQQVGLYATVLTEPAGSSWFQNETGEVLGDTAPGVNPAGRIDGGPTSWQAVIEPNTAGSIFNPAGQLEPYREFYFEYSDFQHAYEAGVYVGADQNGEATGAHGPIVGGVMAPTTMAVNNMGNPANCDDAANAFRCSINPPAREENMPVFPDLVDEIATTDPGNRMAGYCPQRPCPQAIDVSDPGMFVVNYRNEPVAMRVYDPNKIGPDGLPGTQADGIAGDLAFALSGTDDNAQPIVRKFEVEDFSGASTLPPLGPTGNFQVLNIQPKAGNSIYGTVFPPPINEFQALKSHDPFTPMARTMAGDRNRVKIQAGGDEEEHTAAFHGMKWLQAGSAHGGAPNSGWRNAQPGAISEQFTLNAPIVGVVGQAGNSVDYAYTMDTSMDGYWSGMWGLMRVYSNKQNNLTVLSSSPFASNNNVRIDNRDEFIGACPAIEEGRGRNRQMVTENLREYSVTAVLANDILDKPATLTIPTDPHPSGHVGGAPDPAGGTLVYNSRNGGAAASLLHDPTAILYVRTEDMANPDDPKAGLLPGVPVEPLILRANAGDCIDVTLRNRLLTQAVLTDGGTPVIDAGGAAVFLDNGDPLFVEDLVTGDAICGGGTAFNCRQLTVTDVVTFDQMPELATFGSLLGANKRHYGAGDEGSTTFQTNLIQASPWVGLHPQLVEFDGSRDNGIKTGKNNSQAIVPPGQQTTYRWYAGDLAIGVTDARRPNFVLTPTAVEFGGSNLQPADVIKQGMKSMVGQLVIEPEGSTWPDAVTDPDLWTGLASELELRQGVDPNADPTQEVARQTRAMVTVTRTDGLPDFRDLSQVWTKGLTQYYANSEPVEHMNGEGDGIPEDPQDATGMAINYGIEPVWFRLGILPSAHFGNAQSGATTFGGNTQFDVFSNNHSSVAGADPQTPVFTAPAGMPTRMRVTVPHGTNRGSTFALHGHLWQRDPYLALSETDGFPDSGYLDGLDWIPAGVVGSTSIGHNPLGFYQGGQESIWPGTHYDIVLPSAGGGNEVPGDYMFRDVASFGSASGLWGILRVEPPPPPPAP